jgi:hypothetical protein
MPIFLFCLCGQLTRLIYEVMYVNFGLNIKVNTRGLGWADFQFKKLDIYTKEICTNSLRSI